MIKVDTFELPKSFYYDKKDHLWAKVESNGVRVGLDMFGQKAAGTVAYIKIRPTGKPAVKGRAFGSLEAGKYIGPLKAPVNGTIIEVNEKVVSSPSLVNTDSYGDGWFVVIEPSSFDDDIKDLVHGEEAIRAWMEAEIQEYKDKGLLGED